MLNVPIKFTSMTRRKRARSCGPSLPSTRLAPANSHVGPALSRCERAQGFDERFLRMWEFYLAGSECAFRFGGMNNFQIQFTRDQHALPLTRNYMIAEEERLRTIDSRRPRLKSVPAE